MNNSVPKIPPPIHFLGSVAAMILLHKFLPLGRWLLFPWTVLGIIIMILALVLTVGSALYFKKLGTNPLPGVRATIVVTGGAFRYTRNPMYLGFVITLLGLGVLLGTYSPLFVVPLFALILHTKFVLREERWMEEWMGDVYLEYKRKTRRWI